MRVLGIVTARGGSKGLPGKNIMPLCGKPMLAWTAEAALGSVLTRTVLSTDDEQIAEVGRQCGLDVPFLRPAELARDDTGSVPVLMDVVRRLALAGDRYDAVLTLQPTSPLRLSTDIDGAIALLAETGADSVISLTHVRNRHPAKMKLLGIDGRIMDPPFAEQIPNRRRQELDDVYIREGSIYLTRTSILMGGSITGADSRAWLVPPERAIDVDDRVDFLVAQALLRDRLGPC